MGKFLQSMSTFQLFTKTETGVFSPWSIFHTTAGVLAGSFNVPLPWWIVAHQVAEVIENGNPSGVAWEDKAVAPLGVASYGYTGDTALNSAGDTLSATLGWCIGQWLRKTRVSSGLLATVFVMSLLCSILAIFLPTSVLTSCLAFIGIFGLVCGFVLMFGSANRSAEVNTKLTESSV